MNTNKLYGETPPLKLFFKAGIPGVVSMFAMSVYTIIEGIFVGQFIGGSSFAAMNLAMPLVFIAFSLSDMIAIGSSVLISIAHGQKENDRASNIFSCSVAIIVLIAVTMGLITFVFAPDIIGLMGADKEVTDLAVMYLRICAAMNPASCLIFAMDNYMRISGFIRGSMFLNLFMSGLQLGLLVLFVPVLKWGLAGAALAITLGMSVCTAISLVPFVQGKAVLKFVKPKFEFAAVKQTVICGMPIFLSNIAGRLFAIIMNALLIKQGGTIAVSAFSVLIYCGDMVQPLLYGLCDSLQPALGYNWGAKLYGRVKALFKCELVTTACMSAVITAAMLLFPKQLIGIFVNASDVELAALAAHALRLFCTKTLLWWFGYGVQSFYNAIEMPKKSTVLTLASSIVFPLLAVAVLWPMGLDGLWLNQSATYIPVCVLSYIMLKKTLRSIDKQI